jgi:hypothetical protein
MPASRMKLSLMAPAADETQANNLENTLEAAMALNYIYKVIRHYYLLGKKTLSLYIIMQITDDTAPSYAGG